MSFNLKGARIAILAECSKRGIDDGTRRTMLREIGGAEGGSIKALDASGARMVLDHLRRTDPGNEWAFIDKAAKWNQPLLRKIFVLCRVMKVCKAYAEGVARKQHGIERRLEMMSNTDLWKLTGALERTRRCKAKNAPPPEGGIGNDGRPS